jgi:DNA polymerase III alpha subunit
MKFTKITNSSKGGTLNPYFPGWLQERYGDCFAQISVMTTLRLKNACKDVARALLGSVPQDVEDWCKRFEMPPQGVSDIKFILGYDNDEGHQQGSIERDQALQAYIAKYPKHWDIVKNALALPRQRGRHASAFIIASEPISDFIPITTVSGIKVTAFTGPEVEAVGGLKMDFLVVNAIADLQKAVELICKKRLCELQQELESIDKEIVESSRVGLLGDKIAALTARRERILSEISTLKNATYIDGRKVPAHRLVIDPRTNRFVDIWNLPNDQEVFGDISNGRTETVFQFNTTGAVRWLTYFNHKRPDGTPAINSIEAMAIFTALDRPGPLDYQVSNPDAPSQKHNIMVEYARRVRGLRGSADILPLFDTMLPKTNSLMVFQEDLQRVYQELTGCTGSEAEEFRSNIAKKKKEKVDKAYKFFMERVAPKLGEEQALAVWQSLAAFGQYGFNCSHATAYCVISYACAWLKHHYPLQWWCSVLKNATKDETSETFWSYVENLVDLPDLNSSKPTWSIVNGRIRAPIDLCYGIGETAHKQLVQGAPYSSVDDFCKKIIDYKKNNATEGKWGRSAITIGTIYILVASGVMDSLFEPDTSIAQRIDLCETLLKKYTVEAGKKYVKSKNRYSTPDGIGRYQSKKEILPVYSEDIRQFLTAGIAVDIINGAPYYKYIEWDRLEQKELSKVDRIVGRKELSEMIAAVEMPQCGFRCAVVGYVENIESFSYQNKSKTAKKFFIDACGCKQQMVYWPDSSNGFPKDISDIKPGSIVVAVITKTDLNRGFSIRKMNLLRPPIDKMAE